MAVPAVSHRNWERLNGLTVFVMGTTSVSPRELSFSEQLRTVVDEVEDLRAELRQRDHTQYTHADFNTPYAVSIYPDERDRAHRPEVPEELLRDLESTLEEEYPQVPVEGRDFEKQMDMLLDPLQKYYRRLDCHLTTDD